MNNIVVIGSCNIDLTVLASKRPKAGETILGEGLNTSPGGKGANQAVAAAKLGAHVTMVGCIGQDTYGDMMLKNLKQYGIDTTYLVRRDTVPTGTAHITLAEGDNSIIVILGANATVDEAVVDNAWPAIVKADLVLLQNEIPLATIGYAITRCADANIPVLLNPAPAASLNSAWLDKVTYLTPNEHELSALYPGVSQEEVLRTVKPQLLITLGKRGVGFNNKGTLTIVPGFTVTPVDTTGAGDTFNGAFAAAIVRGETMEQAIRYGNAAAALSIQKLGAQEGMPFEDEVATFMKEAH